MSTPVNATWGGNFKSIGDEGILEGAAIVFGSEESPDISQFKDFFTEDTFVHPEEQFVTALYMEHGFSYDKPIGKAIMAKGQDGWTAIAELNMEDPVVQARFSEIKSGGWGFSTGAVGHVVKREAKDNGTHFIRQWSVGELSITKTPAEPKALIHSVKSLDEYYTAFDDAVVVEETAADCEGMMKIIEMLISELTKKHIQELFAPQFEEIKTQLAELKSALVPIGTKELTQQLTVLKSDIEEIKSSLGELQSSFNEKEALLSDEKMALLSETQEQVENKSEEVDKTKIEEEVKSEESSALDEELKQAKAEIECLKKSLTTAKEAYRLLNTPNFSK